MQDRKVKVVRRGESVAKQAAKPELKTARQSARDIVANVSTWVTDLRERKATETQAAIEQLFGGPRTNES